MEHSLVCILSKHYICLMVMHNSLNNQQWFKALKFNKRTTITHTHIYSEMDDYLQIKQCYFLTCDFSRNILSIIGLQTYFVINCFIINFSIIKTNLFWQRDIPSRYKQIWMKSTSQSDLLSTDSLTYQECLLVSRMYILFNLQNTNISE